jgi:hypothetical protein
MARTERTLPGGIAALGPDVGQRIDKLVVRAARREDEALAEALSATLRIVPRPLRGVARKVLAA